MIGRCKPLDVLVVDTAPAGRAVACRHFHPCLSNPHRACPSGELGRPGPQVPRPLDTFGRCSGPSATAAPVTADAVARCDEHPVRRGRGRRSLHGVQPTRKHEPIKGEPDPVTADCVRCTRFRRAALASYRAIHPGKAPEHQPRIPRDRTPAGAVDSAPDRPDRDGRKPGGSPGSGDHEWPSSVNHPFSIQRASQPRWRAREGRWVRTRMVWQRSRNTGPPCESDTDA